MSFLDFESAVAEAWDARSTRFRIHKRTRVAGTKLLTEGAYGGRSVTCSSTVACAASLPRKESHRAFERRRTFLRERSPFSSSRVREARQQSPSTGARWSMAMHRPCPRCRRTSNAPILVPFVVPTRNGLSPRPPNTDARVHKTRNSTLWFGRSMEPGTWKVVDRTSNENEVAHRRPARHQVRRHITLASSCCKLRGPSSRPATEHQISIIRRQTSDDATIHVICWSESCERIYFSVSLMRAISLDLQSSIESNLIPPRGNSGGCRSDQVMAALPFLYTLDAPTVILVRRPATGPRPPYG
jgi:hypothetical protein